MRNLIDSIGDYVVSGSKTRAFFAGGAFSGIVAFCFTMAITMPFVLGGMFSFVVAYSVAIGVGIGSALVNAIFLAVVV